MDRRQFTMLGLAATARLLPQKSCDVPPPAGNKPPSRFKKSDIEPQARKIVVEQLGVDAGKVTDKARFIEDLGADSLDVVELVMAFEEAFDLEIDDEKAEKIVTFGDSVRTITDLLKSQNRLTD